MGSAIGFKIKCQQDEKYIIVDNVSMEQLFDKMPVLKFLILGHDKMEKINSKQSNAENPFIEVHLHKDFEITGDDFILLIHNVNHVMANVPEDDETRQRLLNISTKLG